MKQIEAEQQAALIRWCEDCVTFDIHPELELIFHTPNGGSRNKIEAVKLKRMGVKPGVPDLFLPVPTAHYHGLWIEMKSDNGRLSDRQKWWRDKLTSQGYGYIVAKSAQEAIEGIETYLLIGRM